MSLTQTCHWLSSLRPSRISIVIVENTYISVIRLISMNVPRLRTHLSENQFMMLIRHVVIGRNRPYDRRPLVLSDWYRGISWALIENQFMRLIRNVVIRANLHKMAILSIYSVFSGLESRDSTTNQETHSLIYVTALQSLRKSVHRAHAQCGDS